VKFIPRDIGVTALGAPADPISIQDSYFLMLGAAGGKAVPPRSKLIHGARVIELPTRIAAPRAGSRGMKCRAAAEQAHSRLAAPGNREQL